MPSGIYKHRPCSEKTKIKISKALEGKTLSIETRQKISKSLIGKFEGSKHHFWGKNHSEETKRKISESRAGRFVGSKSPHWKGGRMKRDGYIFILKPNHPFSNNLGYVAEHRLVIEQQIGRYLTPKEIGHHCGKKDDNRPHMLMVFSSRSAHVRFHKDPNNVKPEEIVFDGSKI